MVDLTFFLSKAPHEVTVALVVFLLLFDEIEKLDWIYIIYLH